ncbi:RICIN domain-containing protein [Actinoplanes sp. CA-252034]|uniref:RICIN domain-containing protein n=1 Tax=Actinoplanes sp. CA-252034 TaxID=3239906 RepID=UPI003D993B0C
MHKRHYNRVSAAAVLLTVLTGASPARAADDFRTIVNKLSGKCLTSSDTPDYRVTQATCSPGDRRQWWDFDGDHEDQRFVNASTGRCLTVFGASDGQPVHAVACGLAGAFNHWTWVWTEDDYAYELQPLDARGSCLDLEPGDVIALRTCKDPGGADQHWIFESQP